MNRKIMNIKEKYYELCYTLRIHEFSKIDNYKQWSSGKARERYKSLNDFYSEELGISPKDLLAVKTQFSRFNTLYSKYYNEYRKELFSKPELFLKWYYEQNEECNYCKVKQSQLLEIVDKRSGNLTLNNKTKRSKGTLEIEKLNPSEEYTFKNCVLACPLCNNAKSNLISEDDWREHFVPAMKKYIEDTLKD